MAQTIDGRRSGFDFMSRDSQQLQRDDTANPGMLAVLDGEGLWNAKAGRANRSCADCHQDASTSMKGVAARYPAFSAALNRPIDLQGRINACRETQQQATPLPWESKELLALSAYVGNQSRGMPIAPPDDARLAPFRQRGEALYTRRVGQLNFSCANCHDDNAGGKLASAVIPQAHPTGYPIYRLEWQGIGSLQRRLRGCFIGVRAEPYAYGAQEYVELELFLMSRAKGMTIETPAVRP
ncbi:sulfur oxidation c-type cytochrome SoxA [Bradyrhizobium sp. LHD-71]|uniref:sulfur oxidation c-type cytochrome SoxA n=1 Tax=Bradyrhizobium sp. LHD-71 TaxID=3072141 RepID=UPI00280D2724|nr:sulfur oxidation c-type cytochrome SoxA [Bradyrhizobium sp. LHD-71]MDQ8728720.1 sulfur oxidation c-type cytochrome SoxA [Bradyrhizobium sp. LHD-71]